MPPSSEPGRRLIEPGDLIGNYRIERELAEGGMGTVYVATHTVLPRSAAIKVLRPELSASSLARDGLVREACVIESMHDPRAAALYDAGVLPDGRPWLAMELIDGECLADILSRRQRLGIDEVGEIVCAIVDALASAHLRGVVHGDVKPENVMVCGAERRTVKMIDWGISRTRGGANVQPTVAMGTPQYMAPEQVRGEPLDGRTDIYALGVVAYELLTGVPPFTGEGPSHIASRHLNEVAPAVRATRIETPARMNLLIEAMLRKRPAERPTLEAVRLAFAGAGTDASASPPAAERDGAEDDDPAAARSQAVATDLPNLFAVLGRKRLTPQMQPFDARPTLRLGRLVSSEGREAAVSTGVIYSRFRG